MNRLTQRTLRISLFSACLLAASLAWAQDEAQPAAEPGLPAVPPVNEQDALDQLEAAYQREYAFLEAQLRDLRARVNNFNTTARQLYDRIGRLSPFIKYDRPL